MPSILPEPSAYIVSELVPGNIVLSQCLVKLCQSQCLDVVPLSVLTKMSVPVLRKLPVTVLSKS